ncbi:MAG: hypothetical protein KAJ23_16835, partial [Maribacter sp.]|nr:hypothetical protein [Maribacter sp.]
MVDIWWRGQQNNGDLMLLLAYLLKLNRQWENSEIRILSIVKNKELQTKLNKGLEDLLLEARIPATVNIIVNVGNFIEILHQKSGQSDIVFVGLPMIEEGKEKDLAQNMDAICGGLETVVFVQNNSMSHSIPILLKV